jgi:maltose alpha-D-glucosyltransferase/alpha-amylase
MNKAPLWPADDQQTLRLLERFVLDKALYEIEYELANRPHWAHIPLDAALRILQQRGAIP